MSSRISPMCSLNMDTLTSHSTLHAVSHLSVLKHLILPQFITPIKNLVKTFVRWKAYCFESIKHLHVASEAAIVSDDPITELVVSSDGSRPYNAHNIISRLSSITDMGETHAAQRTKLSEGDIQCSLNIDCLSHEDERCILTNFTKIGQNVTILDTREILDVVLFQSQIFQTPIPTTVILHNRWRSIS